MTVDRISVNTVIIPNQVSAPDRSLAPPDGLTRGSVDKTCIILLLFHTVTKLLLIIIF